MPNRIETCFDSLRAKKRKGFIPYICAGDPSLEKTVDLVRVLEDAGADLVELGISFSDPLADGIVNQLAAQRALDAGTTVLGVLDCVRHIRAGSTVPIVLYTYLNPVLQFGFDQFHREAETAGVDGLLILDLPPEEDRELDALSACSHGPVGRPASAANHPPVQPATGRWLQRKSLSSLTSHRSEKIGAGNLFHVRLIAPTTPRDRVAMIAKTARGFLYYVSREGVTGARETVASSLGDKILQLRNVSDLPIAVGFGVSNAEQAREVARHADAVVVGSAIVDRIAKYGDKPDLIDKVAAFARELRGAI